MPKLRRLSGDEVVRFCRRNDFIISRTRGSHINLVRIVSGNKQVITIPYHTEMDRGTLHGIFKKLMSYVSEEELRTFFYTSDK
jgi:predicted RNA binding protein YcfA (HicA-like mRNA interferase family)